MLRDLLMNRLPLWFIVVSIAIALVLTIVFGFLWNYYIINELKEYNRIFHKDLSTLMEVIAHSRPSGTMQYINPEMMKTDETKKDSIEAEEKRRNEQLKYEYELLKIREENKRLQEEIDRMKSGN